MNTCPHCQRVKTVKNGKTWYGKQNYKCHSCKRPAVKRKAVTLQLEVLLKRLLLERLSLRAIAPVLGISLGLHIPRVKQQWQQVPKQLPMGQLEQPALGLYCLEADELWWVSPIFVEDELSRSGLLLGQLSLLFFKFLRTQIS